MSSDSENEPDRRTPWTEILRVAALVAVFATQLYIAGRIANVPAKYCFTRPFWLDEFHTLAVVNQERPAELFSKLSRGADFNPPGLHFVLWSMSKVTRLSDEWLLRLFSCAVGIGGLTATYFLLRIRFPWRVSWVAVLGMWSSSPQLVQQMFEGRTYSFWFATVAILCLLLGLRTRGVWHPVCVALVAAAMCSIHYFGLITVGLIAASECCCNFRDIRQRRLTATALAAGGVALMVWFPLYLGQRAAVPVPTWLPPPTVAASCEFIEAFIVNEALALPVLAYAMQLLFRRNTGHGVTKDVRDFNRYAGACGLIMLPVMLTVFSYAIQPAQIARYAVPTALAYAPLIALLANKLNRTLLNGIALLFFAVGLKGALVVHEWRPDYHEAASLVSQSNVDRPLVVHWRVIAYPLSHYRGAPSGVVRVSYLYRGNALSRFDEWEQAVARRMAELFDLPKTIELDELAVRDEFHLLAVEGEERRYSGWTAEPLGPVLGPLRAFKMKRHSGASPEVNAQHSRNATGSVGTTPGGNNRLGIQKPSFSFDQPSLSDRRQTW